MGTTNTRIKGTTQYKQLVAILGSEEKALAAYHAAHGEVATPAKATTKAKKSGKKAKAQATVTTAASRKGDDKVRSQGGSLSQREWNRTLTALSRRAGKGADGVSVYRTITNQWSAAQALRDGGTTPSGALAQLR